MPLDLFASSSMATQECVISNQYDASSSLLTTSTELCYHPVEVYYSILIEAVIFAGTIWLLLKIFRRRDKKEIPEIIK